MINPAEMKPAGLQHETAKLEGPMDKRAALHDRNLRMAHV
jgi:hypothetical protein